MKKYIALLAAGSFLMLGACDGGKENSRPAGAGDLRITAFVEDAPQTKFGIEEDNADYMTSGEKFRWKMGDKIKGYFDLNSGMVEPLKFEAVSVNGNKAEFKALDGGYLVFSDRYDLYAFYPERMFDGGLVMDNSAIKQTQAGQSSDHIGNFMPMRAAYKDFENDYSEIDLSDITLNFKHYASLARFSLWNATAKEGLKVTNITITTTGGGDYFYQKCSFSAIDNESLVTENPTNKAELDVTDGGFIVDADSRQVFHGYMALLPTGSLSAAGSLKITVTLTDGTDDYVYTKTLSFDDENQARFLAGGFKKGKSYCFRLKIADGDISKVI